MLTLLNLLSAVALLIWGTHIVRTGILRVYGSHLRKVLSHNVSKRPLAFAAGIGVTALVQSSNATALLVTSFPALAIMLGADVGTALMARVLTLDLSWLSPLLIFLGVVFFLSRKQTRAGQLGSVAIGLGLMLLALELIVAAATPITQEQGIRVLFASLTGDLLLDALVGALFALISYSSLAAVLLTAALTGADLRCVLMLPTVGLMARFCNWLLPDRPDENGVARPRHLDPTALATPSLALANAVRETLRIGDLIETMLSHLLEVLRGGQTALGKELRRLDDDVDAL